MGGEVYLAEYGRAKTIHFDLVEVDGVDLRVDAADGGSDCIVMTDEAAEGTATNDFVDEGTGYSLVLTAAEMAGARITVYVIDSATKAWLDKTIQIETFGHLSSAHPFLSKYWTNGAVNDASASSTVWTFDGFTEATADHVIGSELTFTSGANAGQCRTVTDYTSTVITVSPAFLAAPADNDEFVLEARPTTSAGNVPGVDIAAILVDTAVIGALGAGLTDLGGMSTGMKAEVNAEVDTAFLSNLIIRTNTAQAGADATITLDTNASTTNDTYRFQIVGIISGTGAGQSRPIISYVGSTRVATIEPNWATNPSSDSVFVLIPDGRSGIVVNGITSSQLADTAIDEISDGVWDEAMVASTGAPAITGSMRAFMEWWATLSRNVVNQTATTTTVRNDADDGDISTSTVSDDGTTFVRGEFTT
ncbi:hypothetical protein LCGC14_1065110 [marine sediment metagenome]|uniref:Uncharacterized protein n=1 Tax=marine sediment metagenome TaxID=412755 RepID=A0A0F9Q2W6_9ZZZZ